MAINKRLHMTRRSFLALPAVFSFSGIASAAEADKHHFQYDYILGTSLDLAVWAPNARDAERAAHALLEEIDRLASILNTRMPGSEIRKFEEGSHSNLSPELTEVLAAYHHWERQTGGLLSIRPHGPGSGLNVDGLGKAYVIDRAVLAAREAVPEVQSLVLNIGGDIVVSGRSCEIAVADPASPYDNGHPLTTVTLRDGAIATSGTYARGAHLLDARTGRAAQSASSATVIARDAVTANALALALCVSRNDDILRLVEATPGAAALRHSLGGIVQRSRSFSGMEQAPAARRVVFADWPAGNQLTISLTLTEGTAGAGRGGRGGFGGPGGRGGFGGRGGARRPYVAVWIEDGSGRLVRVLAFWADKPRYYSELSLFFRAEGRDENALYSLARATRPSGSYQLVWDGLDDKRQPVPPGTYKITVETNQEHGTYAKQSGTIVCGDAPATLTLSATANFEAVEIQYGPKQNQA